MSLITEEQVVLDLTGADRHEATRLLGERLVASGRCTDLDTFIADVRKREETMATGLPGGIGIPHARSTAITEPSLVFGRSANGIDWGAKDGPATLIFLIAAPEGGGDAHMQMLPKLARALMKKDFKAALAAATTEAEVVRIVSAEVELDQPAAAPEESRMASAAEAGAGLATGTAAAGAAPLADAPRSLNLVGVTSCPTGIAHTYMAAEGLENAAKAAGHTMKVETQGSAGSKPLTAAEIAAADAVIFAHDLPVKDAGRFAGKPTIDVGVKKGISDGPALIAQAAALASEWRNDPSKAAAASAAAAGSSGGALVSKVEEGAGLGTRIRQWLMTGVSYMIPFVAAGGILIALSFMLSQVSLGAEGPIEIVKYNLTSTDQYNIAQNFSATSLTSWAALLFVIGGASFGFLVPILSGFIAFAIADRPGLVPGIVGGSVAATMGAGFLGGLVTGVLGGLVARWVSNWKVAKGVRGVMPVVVIPLVSSFITIGLFITVLGRPIKALTDALNSWLTGMSGASAIILGVILGAMMGFDLGGPVNKVAYAFATTGLAAAGAATDAPQLKIMAAVMAAGMVAPLAMALATTVRPQLFSEPERENGKAAWLLGASFISEGAIPFAAVDPVRVISSSVVGSAVTGALVMLFGATLRAPHGGIWVLPLIGNFLLFLVALIIGVLVMATIVIALKSRDTHLAEVDATATV
ncbi:PTS system D-fructose-specific IIA component (F1P-forming) (Frc family) /PTS system D-fructose-specific IIB component (F1P-forming) (Frc family) /PTS system D-fructose-specific IIC component (F1P-forming) (Frc family) [Humibacillus xanthopallidus]|uniref:PTS system D-fructose-specific IIA component (F1P-forming) (Frc family) /PTS system D-fructose-specific IIB component (F1P-forming) (Frc family) /PTS system D-fructose-specific IIC component (F1P-f... n=1 Tax=Humibacillus xanthopallidus TaxID=412689 RepID=A0A543PNX3_9MICO|nr:fructose-specific PTS transporter subunit EIIC [Humibacillus xanthopallidus]TQN45727.1 PTS system D-fructose-specific IIA component (F1P-forming) (Frc family) /PTS system D-fructose-specific IIB component (F1P-forming) (Frc family) /PTS system D-fructose-specific IIC component (F1P-forming) (Frc family) [Humibacillus xanthopallidus]